MTMPTFSPDDPRDLLERLLARDVEIEDLSRALLKAKSAYDLAKGELKDALEARTKLSHEIRNPPPLFAGGPGPEKAPTYDDDVAAGVRAAEARCEGEWDLDGAPISPEAMPALTGPKTKAKRGPRKARGVTT